MATAPKLSNILDKPSTAIERPRPLPAGNYVWVVQGMPRHDKSKKKQTPFVEYKIKPLQAMEDVDKEELEAWCKKPDGTTRTLADAEMKVQFYLTDGSAFMLKDFLTACGLNEEEDFQTLREGIEKVPGAQFGAAITHEATDTGNVFARIGNAYSLNDAGDAGSDDE